MCKEGEKIHSISRLGIAIAPGVDRERRPQQRRCVFGDLKVRLEPLGAEHCVGGQGRGHVDRDVLDQGAGLQNQMPDQVRSVISRSSCPLSMSDTHAWLAIEVETELFSKSPLAAKFMKAADRMLNSSGHFVEMLRQESLDPRRRCHQHRDLVFVVRPGIAGIGFDLVDRQVCNPLVAERHGIDPSCDLGTGVNPRRSGAFRQALQNRLSGAMIGCRHVLGC